MAYNQGNGNMYVTNQFTNTSSVINQNNKVVGTVEVGDFSFAMTYYSGNGYIYVANFESDTVSVIGVTPAPVEGIIDSGNNKNIQIQENTGNNVGGQIGNSYSMKT